MCYKTALFMLLAWGAARSACFDALLQSAAAFELDDPSFVTEPSEFVDREGSLSVRWFLFNGDERGVLGPNGKALLYHSISSSNAPITSSTPRIAEITPGGYDFVLPGHAVWSHFHSSYEVVSHWNSFSANGKWLAIRSAHQGVLVVDLRTGRVIRQVEMSAILGLQFWGDRLLVQTEAQELFAIDISSGSKTPLYLGQDLPLVWRTSRNSASPLLPVSETSFGAIVEERDNRYAIRLFGYLAGALPVYYFREAPRQASFSRDALRMVVAGSNYIDLLAPGRRVSLMSHVHGNLRWAEVSEDGNRVLVQQRGDSLTWVLVDAYAHREIRRYKLKNKVRNAISIRTGSATWSIAMIEESEMGESIAALEVVEDGIYRRNTYPIQTPISRLEFSDAGRALLVGYNGSAKGLAVLKLDPGSQGSLATPAPEPEIQVPTER